MPNVLAHFAIHADDTERAKAFYESVFDWTFQPWGPPGFFLIRTGSDAVSGSLHKRHHPVTGKGMIGYECTISVDDVEEISKRVESGGGKVTLKPYTIEGVGTMIQFEDTEGNLAFAMKYARGARPG